MQLTPEQLAAMPPAQVRIRELEQDNMRLRAENDSLRYQLDQQFVRTGGVGVHGTFFSFG